MPPVEEQYTTPRLAILELVPLLSKRSLDHLMHL